jgi:hypothetical protein
MNRQARKSRKKPTKIVKGAAQQILKEAQPSSVESDEMMKKKKKTTGRNANEDHTYASHHPSRGAPSKLPTTVERHEKP